MNTFLDYKKVLSRSRLKRLEIEGQISELKDKMEVLKTPLEKFAWSFLRLVADLLMDAGFRVGISKNATSLDQVSLDFHHPRTSHLFGPGHTRVLFDFWADFGERFELKIIFSPKNTTSGTKCLLLDPNEPLKKLAREVSDYILAESTLLELGEPVVQ